MNENIFDKLDFGPFRSLLDNDDITDISYDNNGQIWIRSLTQGSLRVEVEGATPDFVEKLAFQCSNVMGTTFNNAKPFLDAESAELRMNFVHQSIATNGIALVIRKTPAKIRLEKEKLIEEDYFTPAIHDFLIKCVEGHCNIMVAGETGSGKTEFVKYLASHTKTNEKIITIEDTLELHLDKIFPQRDIVSMKTNNVASYSDVLVTCMRQNPKWILLSEVRSAEAVSAVRNSISSGHNILSTIHADKASAIPYRLYSLMETDLDVHQFLTTIYRYIQLGVHIKAFYSKEYGKFHRELDEVAEFYVDDNNEPKSRIIYQKIFGKPMMCRPSDHLVEYLENQNIQVEDIIKDLPKELPLTENGFGKDDLDSSESDTGGSTPPEQQNIVQNEGDQQESSNAVSTTTDVVAQQVQLGVSSSEVQSVEPQVPVVASDSASVGSTVVAATNTESEAVVAGDSTNVEPAAVISNSPTNVELPAVENNSVDATVNPVSVDGQGQSIPVVQGDTGNVQLATVPAIQSVVPQQQETVVTSAQPVASISAVATQPAVADVQSTNVATSIPTMAKLEE